MSPERMRQIAKLREGIEIYDLKEVDIRSDALLSHHGEQTALYIKATRAPEQDLVDNPKKSRRVHITECEVVRDMRRMGRVERYILTNRHDDKFVADWLDPFTKDRGTIIAPLAVCRCCLRELNYRGYDRPIYRQKLQTGRKNKIWESFRFSEFLMDYSTFFTQLRPPAPPIPFTYIKEWPRISEDKRRVSKYACEQCGVNLTALNGSLHCHHKNGDVADNATNNLAILCSICHLGLPFQSHITLPPDLRRAIENLKVEQGV